MRGGGWAIRTLVTLHSETCKLPGKIISSGYVDRSTGHTMVAVQVVVDENTDFGPHDTPITKYYHGENVILCKDALGVKSGYTGIVVSPVPDSKDKNKKWTVNLNVPDAQLTKRFRRRRSLPKLPGSAGDDTRQYPTENNELGEEDPDP
jgi:hypothetical protein